MRKKDLPIFVQIPPVMLKIFPRQVGETEATAGSDTFTWLRTLDGLAGGSRSSQRVSLPSRRLLCTPAPLVEREGGEGGGVGRGAVTAEQGPPPAPTRGRQGTRPAPGSARCHRPRSRRLASR